MKPWKERALELEHEGFKPFEVHRMINEEYSEQFTYDKVRHYLWCQRKKVPVTHAGPIIQNQEPKLYNAKWDGTQTIKFAIMGDTQFGSKYAQITHLHSFYDICEKEGITDVYHTGDITDGLKMRPGHEYELYEHSADGQVEDVCKHYPSRNGITTHFITGNHDASLYKHVGFDIGRAIARERSDMNYLGRDAAVVYLTPKCTLELRHPWDGSAYSISYRPQKMVEAMESDSKPPMPFRQITPPHPIPCSTPSNLPPCRRFAA